MDFCKKVFKQLTKTHKVSNITLHTAKSQYRSNSNGQRPCQKENKIDSMHPFTKPRALGKCKLYQYKNITNC
jgi:hypothetical protein